MAASLASTSARAASAWCRAWRLGSTTLTMRPYTSSARTHRHMLRAALLCFATCGGGTVSCSSTHNHWCVLMAWIGVSIYTAKGIAGACEASVWTPLLYRRALFNTADAVSPGSLIRASNSLLVDQRSHLPEGRQRSDACKTVRSHTHLSLMPCFCKSSISYYAECMVWYGVV